jgi:DNA-binding XRE family transcriptional regulator
MAAAETVPTWRRRVPPPELGPMLRAARKARGWTHQRLADEIGTSRQTVTGLELGDRCPSRTVAVALADVLGLPHERRAELLDAAVPDAGRDWPGRTHPDGS